MPADFTYETVVIINHEDGTMRVDTTRDGIASQLRRRSFREVTKENSKPYRRFIGEESQFRFMKPKAMRPPRGFGRKLAPDSAVQTQATGKIKAG